MSSSRERQRLEHIVELIDEIDAFMDGLSFEAFKADRRTMLAVERCSQNITEAAIKIGEDRMSIIFPEVAFHAIRGLGNALRHDYDRVDLQSIYDLTKYGLPPLRAACVATLERDHG